MIYKINLFILVYIISVWNLSQLILILKSYYDAKLKKVVSVTSLKKQRQIEDTVIRMLYDNAQIRISII